MGVLTRSLARPAPRVRRRGEIAPLLWLAMLAAAALAPVARSQTVAESQAGVEVFAVIVNTSNSTESLSFDEVRAIFMLERQFWPNGHRIALLLPPQGSPERQVLLQRVYRMTDGQLRRYWVAKLFRGEIPAVPLVLGESSAIVPSVRRSKEAISIVLLRGEASGVRPLTIDGLQPGQPNYPLDSSSLASRSE